MTFIHYGAVTLALLLPLAANAQTPLDMQKSSIVAGFKQMGVPLDGKFQKYALLSLIHI